MFTPLIFKFCDLIIIILLGASFEILADIFTRLSVFDSPKGSSDTFKTHKNSLYLKGRYLIVYKYFYSSFCII